MSEAADAAFVNGEVHTLATPDETHEAVAVRDGRIARVGSTYDVEFLAGIDTTVVDLEGRVLLPGFIDAHTHLTTVGRRLVHADLSVADSPAEAVELLAERAAGIDADDERSDDVGWVLGYGYDESAWDDDRYLTRRDLDRVPTDRPVAAFREDMHVGAVDSTALATVETAIDAAPAETVPTDADGEPTGVLLETALDAIYEAVAPGVEGTRELIDAALAHCAERGITGFHDMVRGSDAPRVYRELDREGALTARVRINYWSDHLDALREVGLGTNDGSAFVRTGAIKTFTDGSIGGHTAKLSEPYADAPDETGRWVVDPERVRELIRGATAAGYQVTAHAIGDVAVEETLDAYAAATADSVAPDSTPTDSVAPDSTPTDSETADLDATDPEAARHRIEHLELADDDAIGRLADAGIVASVQPNFHKWASQDGLYDTRLGDRRTETNRLRDLHDAGVRLAFGSDGMPMDPLLGVHHAVNAPTDAQRLPVTEALRAYTLGSAYAGFDEGRLGTIETGKRADLVALDGSPWDARESIRDLDVALTVVDGDVVYDGR